MMELYCTREKLTDSHGVVRYGLPLRSLGAVEILRRCSEFCGINEQLPCKNHGRQQVINAEDDDELCAARSRKKTSSPSKRNEFKGVKCVQVIHKTSFINSDIRS